MQNDKSRMFLSSALMEMMAGKPYGKISIQEIADRAYVSRVTFYNHFESKDAVLDFLLERSFGELFDSPEGQDLARLLNAVKSSLAFLNVLQDNGLLHLAPKYIGIELMQSGRLLDIEGADRSLCAAFISEIVFYEAYGLLHAYPHLAATDAAALLQKAGGPFPGLSPVPIKSRKADKRTAASIRALYAAGNSLLDTKPPAKIQAADLTVEARLARGSFYRHFSSMQHFWAGMLRQMFMDLLSRPARAGGHSLLSAGGPLFRAVEGKKKLEVIRFFYLLYSASLNTVSDTQSSAGVQLENCRRWCAAVETVITTLLFFPLNRDLPEPVIKRKLKAFRQSLIILPPS